MMAGTEQRISVSVINRNSRWVWESRQAGKEGAGRASGAGRAGESRQPAESLQGSSDLMSSTIVAMIPVTHI
jgi:hypothetical protein